ncbi:MAG: esterase family protein [Bacteroidetes bacterium]|nr:esterase family protein [Bacteroidota bacterium]
MLNPFLKTAACFLAASFFSCSEKEPSGPDSAPPPDHLRWTFSYRDSSAFSDPSFPDSAWDVYFSGKPDSLRIGSSLPQIPWQRISWSVSAESLASHLRFDDLMIETHDSAAVSVSTGPVQVNWTGKLDWDPSRKVLWIAFKKLLKDNPALRFIAIRNPAPPGKETLPDQRMLPFKSGSAENQIRDERYTRIVRTMQRMDSLLIQGKTGDFSSFISGTYFEDGISKADKMNFYKFIAPRMEGMRFDYGNFLFSDLKDGRVMMMYQYNMWKGDSLVDAGDETRYFELNGGIWKETGNKKRFYPAVLSAKSMRADREFYIYLPPGYFNTTKRYPVTYVFPDVTDKPADFVAYRFNEMMDEAIEKKLADPSIVIIMDGGPSAFMTSADKEKGWDFESFFTGDVGPNYDLVLRTLPNRENRRLLGFGQGGLAAFYYLLKYPTLFSSAASVNGRLTQSLRAKHVDGGNPDYWTDKYPAYFLNMMPTYILEKLQFTLFQQRGGQQEPDFSATKTLLESKKADLKTFQFDHLWQDNLPVIIREVF